jgi:multicomponent Na+:H+ antiporter subunit E
MIRAFVFRGLAFVGLWWILAEGRLDGWLLGGPAVVAATWASIKLSPPAPMPIRLAGVFGFLGFFFWNSILGGIQVAGMALRGRADLQPAMIELPVMSLPSASARVLLINALGLMPGTLGVDMDDSSLRLHVLDERLPVIADARALELVIARLFGSGA